MYTLNVATYMDGDDDGIGDFEGLTDRLDHIAKLGVNCVWLLPFYPSPRLDYGYDVTDYYNVAPELGTLGDFVEFSHQARLRGLRLVIDLPINHTSDQHPWFIDARSDPHSPFRKYYIWSRTKPLNANDGVVFPGYQSRVWTYDSRARAWYFHRFYPHQPDLDIMNEAVRDEIFKIVGFWVELGVSGFRIDAAPFVVEEVRPDEPIRRRYEFFGELRNFLSWRKGDAVLLAEANVLPGEMPEYFGDGTRLHMLFAFLANQYAFLTFARKQAEPLIRGLKMLPKLPQLGQWAHFLRNHDELDLGRLSEQERAECYEQFASDPGAWPNWVVGSHDVGRIVSRIGANGARLAQMLLLTLRGTPTMYYGDELGMADVPILPELVQDQFEKNVPGIGVGRDPARTPMRWTDHNYGSFTTGRPWLPMGQNLARCNVESEAADPDSMLSLTRRLLRLRREQPALAIGDYRSLPCDEDCLAYLRSYDGRRLLVILNFSEDLRLLPLPPEVPKARLLLSSDASRKLQPVQETIELKGVEGVVMEAV